MSAKRQKNISYREHQTLDFCVEWWSGGGEGRMPPGVRGTHFRGQKNIFLKTSIFLRRMSKEVFPEWKNDFLKKLVSAIPAGLKCETRTSSFAWNTYGCFVGCSNLRFFLVSIVLIRGLILLFSWLNTYQYQANKWMFKPFITYHCIFMFTDPSCQEMVTSTE